MKLALPFLAISLASGACVKAQQAPVRDSQPSPMSSRPVDLRHVCSDARFADLCTPTSREMPTIIDFNTAAPRPATAVASL